MEKRSTVLDDGYGALWKSVRQQGDFVKENASKLRLTEDSPYRKHDKELWSRKSDDNIKKEYFTPQVGRPSTRRSLDVEPKIFQDIELEMKETQTGDKKEEKGLQISLGRHVSRAPPMLAMVGSQTERRALYEAIKEKVDLYKTPGMFYGCAILLASIPVFLILLFTRWILPMKQEEAPPIPPSIAKRISNYLAWFFHTCTHCPSHR